MDSPAHTKGKTIHIVCGAGTGTQIMYLLHSRGYRVTAGVLNVLDSDYETATQLSINTINEAPFSPITPESYAQNVEMMKKADAIVVSDVPLGWGNIKNLEAVLEASGSKPVVLIDKEPVERDFTGGEASKLLVRLKTSGAIISKNAEELVESLGHIW